MALLGRRARREIEAIASTYSANAKGEKSPGRDHNGSDRWTSDFNDDLKVRIFDGERRMARSAPAAMLRLAGQDGAGSNSAQELKTENRDSKDWSGKGILNSMGGEECAERV